MNRLLSGTRARVLLVTLVTAVLGITGLGAVPTASAAPGGQVSGSVTDESGAPIAGIVVGLFQFDAEGGFWAATGIEDTTKNNGTYSIKKLDPGTYRVGFLSDGAYVNEYYDDHNVIEDADDVEVSEGQNISGIDAVLAEPGVIRGEVTDEEGNGLAGIEITAYGFNAEAEFWEIIGGGSTAADGSYALPFYREGDFRMGFSDAAGGYVPEYYDDKQFVEDADDIPVAFGETVGGIDAVLAVGGHLRGQVTDPQGNGLAGIAVYPSRLVDGEWEFAGGEFGFQTDGDGDYDIGGLPEGTYRLQFEDPDGNYLGEWYDDKTDEDSTQIPLAEGATVDLNDAVLDPAAHVQGTVTDEEGAPLEFVFVAVWRLADDGHWEIAADSETDGDGDYSVDGLPGGTYRVGFQTEGEHVAEYYDDVLTIDAADDVVVDSGATVSDIDAELALAAHIKGTVIGPDGLPGDKVGIDAWRWTGTDWERYEEDFIQQTDVDEPDNGHYDVGGLPPGTYRLEFFAITSGEHEFWDDQPSFELAQDVVVTEAGEMLVGYDVTLEAGQYPFELENLTRPAISGSPVVGQTLTASTGTWNVKGTTYGYQWLAGGAGVGTNSPTYQPTAADVGKAITVTVFASVAGLGSAAATSAPTAAVTGASTVPQPPPPSAQQVANLKLPVIKGTLEVGRRARVTAGLWSPAAVDLTYRWFVGGKRIAKSDKRKLELKEKWVGKRLRVKVVAKAGGYLTTTVMTPRSAKIKS